jgi:hypothetical protein
MTIGFSFMHTHHRILRWVSALVALTIPALAAPFAVFPQAVQLPSPNGQFIVRNVERQAPLSQLDGSFHSLVLEDKTTGSTRKICDYVGVAAVVWVQNDYLIVNQYLNKRTSRAVIFPVDNTYPSTVIDPSSLIQLVPVPLRPQLRENDHIFVEGSRVDGNLLTLHIWGYGKHDADGFSWRCEYSLPEGVISCKETPRP